MKQIDLFDEHRVILDHVTYEMCGAIQHTRRTGSNYMVDPPVLDTDIDYLILLKGREIDYLMDFITYAHVEGPGGDWHLCNSNDAEGRELYKSDIAYSQSWYAMRRGNLNIIVTIDPLWYMRAVAATELCKVLNLKDKDDRISAFRVIRDEDDGYDLNEEWLA